ncbi:MAG: glyoxylate/hydroxypyruvate reductase A [Magnetovibrio sp.]|nr:glyoxylate/hydroxypyruvate reductase A [Magnetovibrio sp.]|tara:strand:- start:1872 stop:2801 length:930 start_codon:yes stop_codon:yes gene_type:complete
MKIVIKVGDARAQWWKEHMASLLPEMEIFLHTEPIEEDAIEFAIVWKPDPGWLKAFPNLRCIVSIGAGIDHILCDPELPPNIPIIRTTGNDLTLRMREYVALHVLRLHRKLSVLEEAQQVCEWRQIVEPPAHKRRVGIMGLGNLGADCARTLTSIGFDVVGWARSLKTLDGVTCFAGNEDRKAFLESTEILVCMLPLTNETENILNSELFSTLPEGACLINVARGEHLVEADLLSAIKVGQIAAATLDVFHEEPLPVDHPFWSHPDILVTPHIASLIDPVAGGERIANNLRKFIAGDVVDDLIPPGKNY